MVECRTLSRTLSRSLRVPVVVVLACAAPAVAHAQGPPAAPPLVLPDSTLWPALEVQLARVVPTAAGVDTTAHPWVFEVGDASPWWTAARERLRRLARGRAPTPADPVYATLSAALAAPATGGGGPVAEIYLSYTRRCGSGVPESGWGTIYKAPLRPAVGGQLPPPTASTYWDGNPCARTRARPGGADGGAAKPGSSR